MTTVITLPFPPSVNNLFMNVPKRGRIPTKAYEAWQKRADEAINAQSPVPVVGQVEINIALVAPTKARRDADNCLKAPLDRLVANGIIEADDFRFVRRVTAEWADEGAPCTVTVRRLAA